MNFESLRDYCLSKKSVTESFPFNESVLVFKVENKMFLLTDLEDEFKISVKCDPDLAIELREKHSFIKEGYHLNKRLWNTIYIRDEISDSLLIEWIDHSYNEVVKTLPKKVQAKLKEA